MFLFLLTQGSATLAQSFLWHKQFSGNLPNGSTGWDVALDGSGNIYVVGAFSGTINFGNGNENTIGVRDFFYAKYNANGTLAWFKKIGAQHADVTGRNISLYTSGGSVFLYVSGTFTSFNGQMLTVNFDPGGGSGGNLTMNDTEGDAFVAKYNASNGSFVWAKRIENTGASFTDALSIAVDGSGNAYTLNRAIQAPNYVTYLRKFNASNGNALWSQAIGDTGNDMAIRNNVVYVCGSQLDLPLNRLPGLIQMELKLEVQVMALMFFKV